MKIVRTDIETILCLSRVQRIARRLLAEGRAANYDEAEVAASLLALKFGDAEALQAAKECSSVESALAFLQQECELCTGRFAMSQVSVEVLTSGRKPIRISISRNSCPDLTVFIL